MRVLIISIFSLVCLSLSAQDSFKYGHVSIVASDNIDMLVRKHIKMNEKQQTKKGFRIQLIQNSDRSKVEEKKAQFLSDFPDLKPHLVYSQPYFKLRVGDFDSRLEAYPYYKSIIKKFSTATIVPDQVNIEL